MFLDKQVAASSPLMPLAYANFETNLRDTIAFASASGARVIVATVATNVKDCAPFASMHREGLSAGDLRLWNELVQRGSDLESGRSHADALKAYLSAEQIDNQYAELEFRIARSMWVLGDYRGAKQHFFRARDLDTLRFRADSKINDINRAAGSASGAELVDVDDIFSKASPNGIIGSDLVYEHVHLTAEGNYLLARAVFQQIVSKFPAETGRAPSLQTNNVPSQAECEQMLAFTGHDKLRINREMLQRLDKPPFTTQLNHADQVLRLTIKAGAPDESPDATAAEYQWAIRQKPDDRILRYNFGLFLFDYNRQAAAQQLRLSRPWDGFPVFAPDGTPID
jgi:tetratricopeptide (TPR) repeat protein